MNFQQHTFAKLIRIKFLSFVKIVIEKSIVLLYKLTFIFDFMSKIEIIKFSIKSFIFKTLFSIHFHFCRIYKDIFESNNNLHRYLRFNHFNQIFRQNFRKRNHFDRNIRDLEIFNNVIEK